MSLTKEFEKVLDRLKGLELIHQQELTQEYFRSEISRLNCSSTGEEEIVYNYPINSESKLISCV